MNTMVGQEQKSSMGGSKFPNDNGLMNENVEATLISRRKSELRNRKSNRCTMARRRLKAVYHMRKYYGAVIGLTVIEAVLVICRLILETEALRNPPGITRTSIEDCQLALLCISMPTLLLFLLEQPFKWWALGSHQCCKSIMLIVDALVCMFCFSINIYNIHMNATRLTIELASASQVTLCGLTHITHPPETWRTFAIIAGIVILYRLSCIRGYIHKTVTKDNKETQKQLVTLQNVRQETESRLIQLENMVRKQSIGSSQPRSTGRQSGSSRSQKRSSSNRRMSPNSVDSYTAS